MDINVSQSEVCIIGGILMRPDILKEIRASLTVNDFSVKRHQLLYQAILDISDMGDPIIPTAIIDNLKLKRINGAGVFDYLANIIESVSTSTGWEYHVRQIKGNALRQEMLKISSEIKEGINLEDPQEFLDNLKERVNGIKPVAIASNLISLRDALPEVVGDLDKKEEKGIPTGFSDLDDLVSGWQNGDLIILAGRPGMGKSVLSKDFAEAAKVPTVIFSLEMPYGQLVQRQLSSKANINFSKIRRRKLGEKDWPRVMDAMEGLQNMPIFYSDKANMDIDELIGTCHQYKDEKKIEMVIIDYLQLISSRTKSESREQEVSSITRKLKILARSLNIPVICLAQVNRKCEERGGDKIPILSDLRESGAIEQDADIVMFVWREAVYKKKADKYEASLIVAKGRNTGTGVINVYFDGSRQVFSQNPIWRE
jgi:replicative DNA helicase